MPTPPFLITVGFSGTPRKGPTFTKVYFTSNSTIYDTIVQTGSTIDTIIQSGSEDDSLTQDD
jgi:hypothetical protein